MAEESGDLRGIGPQHLQALNALLGIAEMAPCRDSKSGTSSGDKTPVSISVNVRPNGMTPWSVGPVGEGLR